MVRLHRHNLRFPSVEQATPEGLLAVGGDLRPERLLEAYRHGIFPWHNEDDPILWWSPDPRAVLFPRNFTSPRKGLPTVAIDPLMSTTLPERNCAGLRFTPLKTCLNCAVSVERLRRITPNFGFMSFSAQLHPGGDLGTT